MEKRAKKFRSFTEAEKADRDFYKKLSGNERLQILVELINHVSEQRLERISRIIKFPRRWVTSSPARRAMAFHRRPHYTGDLDILIRPPRHNPQRQPALAVV